MIVSKAVLSAVVLMAALNKVSTRPQPSIIRERHIIHAPIKFRVIHHYKIKKVPIIIKKHLHYHKPYTEKVKPVLEEIHANHVYHDDSDGNSAQFDFHPQDDSKDYSSHGGVHLKDDSKVSVAGFHQEDGKKGYSFHFDVHPQSHRYEVPVGPSHGTDHDNREEDYEEIGESQENYDDYEYE